MCVITSIKRTQWIIDFVKPLKNGVVMNLVENECDDDGDDESECSDDYHDAEHDTTLPDSMLAACCCTDCQRLIHNDKVSLVLP